MPNIFAIATNPVIRTVMLGLTGAFLVFFLVIHIIGNYLIFVSPEAYNGYSHFLLSLPFLPVIEIVLLVCFLYHASVGVWSKLKNRLDARDRGDAFRRIARHSRRILASRTAHITDSIMLVALIVHVITMKYGEPDIPGPERDIYNYVIDMFSSLPVVAAYVAVLAILGVHLFHGLGTLYESFGIAHRTWMRRLGQAVALVLLAAYAIFPVLVYIMF